jgi:hypothetical protein
MRHLDLQSVNCMFRELVVIEYWRRCFRRISRHWRLRAFRGELRSWRRDTRSRGFHRGRNRPCNPLPHPAAFLSAERNAGRHHGRCGQHQPRTRTSHPRGPECAVNHVLSVDADVKQEAQNGICLIDPLVPPRSRPGAGRFSRGCQAGSSAVARYRGRIRRQGSGNASRIHVDRRHRHGA